MTNEERDQLRLLANGLMLFGMDKEDSLLTMEMVYKIPQGVKTLTIWMSEHPKATPDDITNQVLKMLNERTKSHSNRPLRLKNPAK